MGSKISTNKLTSAPSAPGIVDLDPFFQPSHIAVLGASSDPGRVGGRPVAYLQRFGYRGQVSPVNPNRSEIAGLPCYASVSEIPTTPDLALIALSGSAALAALEECGERGIPSAVLFTSELIDNVTGEPLENRMLAVARHYGMRLSGPNTLGLISSPTRTTATFATCLDQTSTLPEGNVCLISQSGALGTYMHRAAQQSGLAIRHFVATGNELDLGVGDYLRYLVEDEGTCAIGLYLEGVRDGSSLVAGLKRAQELGKPVVAMKVGRSEVAKKAAQSHTGALAGEDKVIDAVLRQFGAIRVHDVDDLLAFLQVMSPNRGWAGGSLGVVTLSGGFGVWSADLAEQGGARLAEMNPATREMLEEVLPRFATVANPLDVTGQVVNETNLLERSVSIMAQDPGVDAILVGLGNIDSLGAELAEGIVRSAKATSKPIVVAWMNGPEEVYVRLHESGIPTLRSLGIGIRASVNASAWSANRERWLERSALRPVGGLPADVRSLIAGSSTFTEAQAKDLLARIGVEGPRRILASDPVEAANGADRLGFPVVLKAQIPGLVHKTELGFVKLDLKSADEVAESFERMSENALRHHLIEEQGLTCLVEEMVENPIELILGYRKDPTFGAVLVLGLGGTEAELFSSVATRRLPLNVEDIQAMLAESNADQVLRGFRAPGAGSLSPLIDTVAKFSNFVLRTQDQFAEIEINPLAVVRGTGRVVALDALIVADETRDHSGVVTGGESS